MRSVLDFVLVMMTGGLWLIWIIIRHVNNSKRR